MRKLEFELKFIIFRSLDHLKNKNAIDCYGMQCWDVAAEPSNKILDIMVDIIASRIETLHYRTGHHSLHILDESISNVFTSFIFDNFNPFYELFNNIILQMHSTGFTQQSRQKSARYGPTDSKVVDDVGPQVLTMDHLGVAFIACALPLVLAVIVFVGEICYPRIRKIFVKAMH